MSFNETPRANRLHIGIFGKRNSGKSSLINALTGQDIALVSDTPGTTTDPVFKSMELHPIGPVVFIDTAGFDDQGQLGGLRVKRTEEVVGKTDIGIMVIDGEEAAKHMPDMEVCAAAETAKPVEAEHMGEMNIEGDQYDCLIYERQWIKALKEKNIPVIIVVNKCDESKNTYAYEPTIKYIKQTIKGHPVIALSAVERTGIEELRKALENFVPEDFLRERILGGMIEDGGLALLVMPQDIQAPKGRLILPQVQTLRELLDKRCTALSTTVDRLDEALDMLKRAPDLIITDSQCFDKVYEKKPESSDLTSFSVLFAAYKGDIKVFEKGALALNDMTEKSRVLIAEACTHVPLSEDIGREKIPKLLHKKFGPGMKIVNLCGNDFPEYEELKEFDLVIHCGACMFNRKHVMTRIAEAEAAGVPITNYGITLAWLAGILDKVKLPK